MFQSTHPRGVRPGRGRRDGQGAGVSIHAPAWGATEADDKRIAEEMSFNPRTRVGCDLRPASRSRSPASFNPRTRVGCDAANAAGKRSRMRFQSTHPRGVRRAGNLREGAGTQVSIHAPAWGATGGAVPVIARYPGFNPRTRVGCDWHGYGGTSGRSCFNPRTRVGCDAVLDSLTEARVWVSIHAPAWGATQCARRGPVTR